ncbi:glycosyltransferase [bacterium]|nr:glycosyltransferase [bacterium]
MVIAAIEPNSEVLDYPSNQTLRHVSGLTVLVPAYNEGASILDTIHSLQNQTRPVDRIIVIDDCSTDNTAEIARSTGVDVMRPPKNTGSKAGAQNYALQFVETELCMAIDADTIVAPDAIEKIVHELETSHAAAACGYVIPRHVRTVWERGRYVEYLFAFTFFKQIQDVYEKPLISSGCFSVYRSAILKEMGGWSRRTLAEDIDLTWTLYESGHKVRFVPDAVCYPIEPETYHFMKCQLTRWSHGFLQNLIVHWRRVLDVPFLRSAVTIMLWDSIVASILYLTVIPIFSILISPVFLLGYVIDLPAVAVPVLWTAAKRGEIGKALLSLLCFPILRIVNGWFMLKAAWYEFVLRRSFKVYVKGH